MRAWVLAAMLAAPASSAVAAATGVGQPRPVQAGSPLPQLQQPIINLSLIDALVAIKAENLAGLFGYISEANAAPALADFLFRDRKALKLFLKKNEKDMKAAGGISEWDKQVCLYIITINMSGSQTGAETLPEGLLDRVSTLSLAPGLPLSDITMRRGR